ncbi:MAG: hypothetical protein PWQ12_1589 [Clostridiales bacterium]|jgi:DNA-binding transcriptional LysR family regulator|nr:hypothetical protein [Clostridiales bacterium]
MKLSQLRHFQAVCEYNSVTLAARAMHITQPSVSSSIRELESELGVNLFHRVGRRLALTQEGEYLLERVSHILRQLDALEIQMRDFGSRSNTIRIGVPPMIGTFLFPVIFDAFHEAHPEIKFQIVEHGSIRTKQMVLDDELDVAIAIVGDSRDEALNKIQILRTSLQYCVAPTHLLAGHDKIRLSDLGEEPLIFFKDDSFQSAVLTEAFSNLGIRPDILLSSSQLYTIKKVIAQGRSGAFLFKEIAEMESDIVGIPLEDQLPMEIYLIWKKERYIYREQAAFIEFIQAYDW